MLQGSTAGGYFGLVILMREGVAAWMEDGLAQNTTIARPPATDRRDASTFVSDVSQVDLVAILASIAFAMTHHPQGGPA